MKTVNKPKRYYFKIISLNLNYLNATKDLNETKQKLVEFQNIAKKIIQTDLILRKYSDKEKECEKLVQDFRKIKRYTKLYNLKIKK